MDEKWEIAEREDGGCRIRRKLPPGNDEKIEWKVVDLSDLVPTISVPMILYEETIVKEGDDYMANDSWTIVGNIETSPNVLERILAMLETKPLQVFPNFESQSQHKNLKSFIIGRRVEP